MSKRRNFSSGGSQVLVCLKNYLQRYKWIIVYLYYYVFMSDDIGFVLKNVVLKISAFNWPLLQLSGNVWCPRHFRSNCASVPSDLYSSRKTIHSRVSINSFIHTYCLNMDSTKAVNFKFSFTYLIFKNRDRPDDTDNG